MSLRTSVLVCCSIFESFLTRKLCSTSVLDVPSVGFVGLQALETPTVFEHGA